MLKTKKRAAALLLAVCMMLMLSVGALGANETEETDVSVPGTGNVLVSLSGTAASSDSEKQAVLNFINAIRKAAYESGEPNPAYWLYGDYSAPKYLDPSMYEDLKWSEDMEQIAQIRAAEAMVVQGETRPNGQEAGTLTSSGSAVSDREDLMWAYGTTATNASLSKMVQLLCGTYDDSRGEYSEQTSWLSGHGDPTQESSYKHYAELISPDYHYVGVASFRMDNVTMQTQKTASDGTAGDVQSSENKSVICAVQELSKAETLDEDFRDLNGSYTQKIEVSADQMAAMDFASAKSRMAVGDRENFGLQCTLRVTLSPNLSTTGSSRLVGLLLPNVGVYSGATWQSSAASVASVNSLGDVRARAEGTAVITAAAGSLTARQSVTVGTGSGSTGTSDYGDWFDDITPDQWFYTPANYCASRGLMSGVADRVFDGNSTVNRAMVVTTLWAMQGKPEPQSLTTFSDVPEGRYFTDSVSWAHENGIVDGYTTGEYKPMQAVTRQQLVAILYKYAQKYGLDTTANGDLTPYTDTGDISVYAVVPLRWAIGHGMISGATTTTLDPKGNTTRAQLATILMRFDENFGS